MFLGCDAVVFSASKPLVQPVSQQSTLFLQRKTFHFTSECEMELIVHSPSCSELQKGLQHFIPKHISIKKTCSAFTVCQEQHASLHVSLQVSSIPPLFLTRFTWDCAGLSSGTSPLSPLLLSHGSAGQVSGPRGSVTDRAIWARAAPRGFQAGERGQKPSRASLHSPSKWAPFRVSQGTLHFLAW